MSRDIYIEVQEYQEKFLIINILINGYLNMWVLGIFKSSIIDWMSELLNSWILHYETAHVNWNQRKWDITDDTKFVVFTSS